MRPDLIPPLTVVALLAGLAAGGCSREAGAPASPQVPARTTESPPPELQPVELPPSERQAIEARIDEAEKLTRGARADEALRWLDELRDRALPADLAAAVLRGRGEGLFARGKSQIEQHDDPSGAAASLREAAKTLDDLLRRFPGEDRTPSGAYLLGSSYLMLDEWTKALGAYQTTFDRYPQYENRARALLRVGVCQASLGEATRAMETFRRVLREFPTASDGTKARKYLAELGIVGRVAPPIGADSWLLGIARGDGLETFRGEVIVVIFFATWCENCRAELPQLRRRIQTWGERGATFLGVADPDDPQNTEPVDVHVQRYEIPYVDVGLDRGRKSWGPYRVGSLPAGVVIDRRGVIRWRGHPAFFPTPLLEKVVGET